MKTSDFVCGTYFSDMSKVPVAQIPKMNTLPQSFNLSNMTYPMFNQGNRGICASCSMTDTLRYIDDLKKKNREFPRDYFYEQRSNKKQDGMTIRECMDIAKSKGFIKSFGKLQSINDIKTALAIHSPVIITTRCYEMIPGQYDFWRPNGELRGGHATVLVGYNKDGFILKNSWGKYYGNEGYTIFPYEDFKYLMEAWTIFV